MTTFTFPFPPRELNPNCRTSWQKKARFVKKYRWACKVVALECRTKFTAPLIVDIVFHPPNNRRRDKDNLIAAFKAGQDGLADALGVDDSLFDTRVTIGDTCQPNGSVVVTVHPALVDVNIIGTINEGDTPCR